MAIKALTAGGNDVRFLPGGSDFFTSLKEKFDRAKKFIHIQIYIFIDDETGKPILESLKQAVKRGVSVFLMVDDYGSADLKKSVETDLIAAGVHFKRFSKRFSFKNRKLGRRLHTKAIVIDNEWAYVGGMNIANRYSGSDGKEPWLDFAIEVHGPAAYWLNRIISVYWRSRIRRTLTKFPSYQEKSGDLQVRWTINDWFRNRFMISVSYKSHFKRAQKEIRIVAGYFFPTARMINILRKSAKRGVRVMIILSNKSDVPFVLDATRFFYRFLFKSGIEIYEWNCSVLHAKLAVVDGNWVTVGSYNINQLSDFGSLEVNGEIENKDFAQKINTEIDRLITQGCTKIEPQDYIKRMNFFRIARYAFSYLLVRLALKLLFIGGKKRSASDEAHFEGSTRVARG